MNRKKGETLRLPTLLPLAYLSGANFEFGFLYGEMEMEDGDDKQSKQLTTSAK